MTTFLKLEELKKIDQDTQFTVFGFIRDVQQLFHFNRNPDYAIPKLVMYIVLNFYYQGVFWDKIAQGFTLSDDKQSITKTASYSWNNTSYTNIEIDSTERCIAKWYIKTNNCGGGDYQVMIGIIGGRQVTDSGIIPSAGGEYNYSYWSSNGCCMSDAGTRWRKYGNPFNANDEICCVLDLKTRQVSFELNGRKQGIACKEIKCEDGFKYRLGVSTFYKDSTCTITRFEKQR